jgi:YihY family inner membrane protein
VDFRAPLRRFDDFQRPRPWLAIPVAVVKKFADDQAGRLAALVAYYGFLSLFPLLLVFATVLGFVLSGDPDALKSAQHSVLGQFPIIGDAIKTDQLGGSATALVIGLALSLWGGLAITDAARYALDRVWNVPRKRRAGFLRSRLYGIVLLLLLGGMFLVASAATGIISGGLVGTELHVFGVLVSLMLNFALFLLSFRLLCSEQLKLAWLVPGAGVASIAWEILTLIGGAFVGHIANSRSAYGGFAVVLGVLAWLHLGAQATVYSAELNVVLARKLWPQALFRTDDRPPHGE